MQSIRYTPIFLAFLTLLGVGIPATLRAGDTGPQPEAKQLVLRKVITGDIRPKSIVHSGTGRFFAQNMTYRHNITVYDRNYNLVGTISDQIRFADYSITGYTGAHQGGPVEATFSPDGSYAWVSNYQMSGQGFDRPGNDDCDRRETYDPGFVYQVNTRTLAIERVIKVGSTPKYLACTPDGRQVLVSNWCSGDLSVIDTELGVELQRVPLGNYPRGIAIDSKSRYAYVSVMGDDRIARVKLSDYSIEWLEDIGKTPRHLCLGPADRYLYVSLSREGELAKLDLVSGKVIKRKTVGKEARSMALTAGGEFLYVVSYKENTLSKVDAATMEVVEVVETREKPIGLTLDPETRTVWVACYTGSIMVFEDQVYPAAMATVDLTQAGPLPPLESGNAEAITYVPHGPDRSVDPYYHILPNNGQDPVPARGRGLEPRVEPAPPTHTPTPVPAPTPAPAAVRYHVILGSYGDMANAQQRIRELEALGLKPTVLRTSEGAFRVSGMSFSRRESAVQAAGEIKSAHNIDAWIHRQ